MFSTSAGAPRIPRLCRSFIWVATAGVESGSRGCSDWGGTGLVSSASDGCGRGADSPPLPAIINTSENRAAMPRMPPTTPMATFLAPLMAYPLQSVLYSLGADCQPRVPRNRVMVVNLESLVLPQRRCYLPRALIANIYLFFRPDELYEI